MTALHNRSSFDGEMKLTPCEFQVCNELVNTPLVHKQIAVKLGKSAKTLEVQIASAYKKLGVSSRFELIQRFENAKEVQVSHLFSSDVVHRIMLRLDEIESKLNALLTERALSSAGFAEPGHNVTDSQP